MIAVPSAAIAVWSILQTGDETPPAPVDRGRPTSSDRSPPLWVDRSSLGGPCRDGRTVQEATSPSTPWCSLAKAVESAPPGRAVRVRAGDYGRLEILGRRHSPAVTFKANPTERVQLSEGVRIEDSTGFRVEGFRISSRRFTSSVFRSERIAIVRNDFSPRGLVLRAVEHSMIARNLFHDIVREAGKPAPDGYALYILGISAGHADEKVQDLAIRGNRFLNIPNDGIQLGGGPSRVFDVTIEDNEFSGVRRRVETDHPDPIQVLGGDGVTIRSNYFHDSEVALLIKDDITRGLVVEDNVMIGAHGGGIQAQLWDTPGARVLGNTIWGSQLGGLRLADRTDCCGTPSAIVVRHNIIDEYADGSASWVTDQDHNVILSGTRRGPHDVALAPRFEAGWRPVGLPPGMRAGAPPFTGD